MKITMKAVWYIDDNGVRHITTITDNWMLDFLKERFYHAGVIDENEQVC